MSMLVLVDLHADEGGSDEHGGDEPLAQPGQVAVLNGGERLDHRHAAADQQEGVEGGDRNGEHLARAPSTRSGWAKRRMMYAPIRAVKNMTSEPRKTHIPSFLL